MSNTAVLNTGGYTKLLSDIRKLIDEGKGRVEAAARRELIFTYWNVGKRLLEEDLSGNAGYFISILEDISAELDIDVSTLKRSIQFYQTYPKFEEILPLKWSQYKLLLPIVNDEKRKFYETLTVKNSLNCRSLKNAITNKTFETDVPALSRKEGKIQITRPTEPTYIYKAVVDRVIDGDTVLVKLDLGFQVWRDQRLRLAHINAPAMDEPGGQEAYQYVRNALAEVDFVMVKTNKIDIYGRYVGHIFYSQESRNKDEVFREGSYLNQELVTRGLARVV